MSRENYSHNRHSDNFFIEWHVKTAQTLDEDQELLKARFEYVTERDDIRIYRKVK